MRHFYKGRMEEVPIEYLDILIDFIDGNIPPLDSSDEFFGRHFKGMYQHLQVIRQEAQKATE